jgi:hypothetical protein
MIPMVSSKAPLITYGPLIHMLPFLIPMIPVEATMTPLKALMVPSKTPRLFFKVHLPSKSYDPFERPMILGKLMIPFPGLCAL